MTWLGLLLLLAANPRVDLLNDVFEVPASDWRYVEVSLRQSPVVVGCDFEVLTRGGSARVALLDAEDLARRRRGRQHGVARATRPGTAGVMRFRVEEPGQYAVLLENLTASPRPIRVHLHVYLDFGMRDPHVRYLSPERRTTVIVLSFGFFFAVVIWTARRLLRAKRN